APPVAGGGGNMGVPGLWDALPVDREVDGGGARIGMVHIPGSSVGREARLAERFPGCRAVVYGHTHVPQVARHGDVWILNPGSPTERRRAPTHSLLLLTVEGATIRPELVRL